MNDNDLKYDRAKEWVKDKRRNGDSWENINKIAEDSDFLSSQKKFCNWPEITADEMKWIIVKMESDESAKRISNECLDSMIASGADNLMMLPLSSDTSWVKYKEKLEEDGFSEQTIENIQESSFKILKKLSDNTDESGPVKGMVIGNVQSGKTANMAGLMAMAADNGINFFIVLTGTIENLRMQTEQRLRDDLGTGGNLTWQTLRDLKPGNRCPYPIKSLNLQPGSHNRYMYVCLKNSRRLGDLVKWIQSSQPKAKQLKILVIDDEADQASVNTAKIEKNKRTQINKHIMNLVNGTNDKKDTSHFQAMNYIGYTATPYSNILNEAGKESLYPKDFIYMLGMSKEYFGPEQIFGTEGVVTYEDGESEEMDGLSIVREVSEEDLESIQDIHQWGSQELPKSLVNSICWFLCTAAALRFRGYHNPVSMLIHTSQRTTHHDTIAAAVQSWFVNHSPEQILEACRTVWKDETEEFTLNDLKNEYPEYANIDSVADYPSFDEIKEELEALVREKLTTIRMNEDSELEWTEGVHLCIDNYTYNSNKPEDAHFRLAYPSKEEMPAKAPAFIVIGGTTLSRGLTIEGLVSTYFLRSVRQADTLMQMGRWFGYRKGYELYPRIWITNNTRAQLEFLSTLDMELRNEITTMETVGATPADYGPHIKNTPKMSFIRITSKNKMQSAESGKMNYQGLEHQTYLFKDDAEVLLHNLDALKKFVENLGKPETKEEVKTRTPFEAWRNVSMTKVEKFLKSYEFQENQSAFVSIEKLISWMKSKNNRETYNNWNVVLVGAEREKGKQWQFSGGQIGKVSRSRKIANPKKGIINIGSLISQTHLLLDALLEDTGGKIKIHANMKRAEITEARLSAGVGNTPLLLLYVIDKDSKPVNPDNPNRSTLDAPADIAGLAMLLPGVKNGRSYADTLAIPAEKLPFIDKTDLEDIDEN